MSFEFDFDVQDAGEMQSFGTVPAAKYTGMIIDSDRKATKGGDGEYALFVFELQDEGVKGRKLFIRCNLVNKNQQAVDIGKAELKAIVTAILGAGAQVRNAAELHEKPIELDVGVRKNKNSGEMENHVKGYAPLGGASTAPAAAPAPTKQPWKR